MECLPLSAEPFGTANLLKEEIDYTKFNATAAGWDISQ